MLWDHKTSPSLLLSVSLFSFVYMYHLSYSGTKMISIRFYGHRPSHRGGTVRSFFHDLIVYKGHCTHWKTVKKNYGFPQWGKNFQIKKNVHTAYMYLLQTIIMDSQQNVLTKNVHQSFFTAINSHNIWAMKSFQYAVE